MATTNEVIRTLMKKNGVTYAIVAKWLGLSSRQGAEQMINAKWWKGIGKFVRLLDLFDYELVAQPRARGPRREGTFVIGPEGDDGGDEA